MSDAEENWQERAEVAEHELTRLANSLSLAGQIKGPVLQALYIDAHITSLRLTYSSAMQAASDRIAELEAGQERLAAELAAAKPDDGWRPW